ncbi:excinuclease ABC subunit C [Dialister micraerophilus DSM 19965]|uniref:Excinuclease ABC subunit C n=2 Tax=Dialister micraerophilus TaxID=309120 RepID=F2BVK3_9FIRM|nr:excinuclease ABC subunit C [Dialister micraerophilus DSM 19965]
MNVTRPCLQYHINLCSAPCCNLVSQEKYNEYVKKLCNIFEGKSYEIIKTLKEKMKEASENLQFEKAAMYRDEINAVKSVQQRQNIVSKEGDFDVIGMARTENYAAFEIFYIRYGRMVGKENFNISGTEDERDESIIAAFLKNFYSSDNINIPKEIIISKIPEDFELIKKWLSGIRHNDVSLIVPERGFKRKLKEMAIVNATKYLSDKKIQWEHQKMREQGALIKLKEILKLPKIPERIECFDISHNQGSETTGSMVVFVNGRPEKKAYRKFKLKTTQGKPDDFKSMAEVMERRYNDKKIGRNPDLIVLDGGKGQLNAAVPLIRNSGIEATVIGLAKRMEEIYLENQTEPIVIDRHDEVLHLLQFVRDESHRFVINYHRQWISKRNRESILDHIEGIGPVRRKNLWAAFRTLDDMKKASVEELQKVKGINKKVAENIYNFFRMKKDEKQQILYNSKKD